MEHDLGARNVHIGPSDYVQWLDDRKCAYVCLEQDHVTDEGRISPEQQVCPFAGVLAWP